jgi:hypothetical protein
MRPLDYGEIWDERQGLSQPYDLQMAMRRYTLKQRHDSESRNRKSNQLEAYGRQRDCAAQQDQKSGQAEHAFPR